MSNKREIGNCAIGNRSRFSIEMFTVATIKSVTAAYINRPFHDEPQIGICHDEPQIRN